MDEMEKSSRAFRCLEKAIKEHGERLTTLTNTVKEYTNYTRTYNREEKRRAEKRDEQRRQEREEDRKRREARERGRRKTHIQSQERGRGKGKMGRPYRPSWPNATQITRNQKSESGTVKFKNSGMKTKE